MASNILNVLENVEKGRQNCIKNAKLANLPATDNMDIFNIGNLFLEQNNTEFIDPNTPWQRPNDWWDTENIIRNAQDIEQNGVMYHPIYCMLLKDWDATTTVSKSAISNQQTSGDAYIFSDEPDTLYVGDQTHTWDVSKDKPCSLGYKTRYIIVYTTKTSSINGIDLDNFKMIEIVTGNMKLSSSSSAFNVSNKYILSMTFLETTNFQGYFWNISGAQLRQCKILVSDLSGSNYSLNNCKLLSNADFSGVTKVQSLLQTTTLKSISFPNLKIHTSGDFISNNDNLKTINLPLLEEHNGGGLLSSCSTISSNSLPSHKKINSSSAFANCFNLSYINLPVLETLHVYNSFCYNCYSLTEFTFPNTLLNLDTPQLFTGCINLKTINLVTNWNWSLNVKDTDLTHECIIDMFNKLKDLTGADSLTLTIGANNLAKVTDEEKLIATNKNWILA